MPLIVDPGSGLVDGVDSAILGGATGVHNRFNTVYDLVNGNIDSSNVDDTSICTLAGVQTFTGTKTFNAQAQFSSTAIFNNTATFNGATVLRSGAVTAVNRSISINSGVPELYNGTTSHADVLHREDGYNEAIYASADINLGTSVDGSFVDVDATNAKIDFTVNVPGRYKVEFDFAQQVVVGSAATSVLDFYFRLTDGTTNSTSFKARLSDNDTSQTTASFIQNISCVFNFTTTGSKSVKLQKRVTTAADVSSNDLLSSGADGVALVMRAYRISN